MAFKFKCIQTVYANFQLSSFSVTLLAQCSEISLYGIFVKIQALVLIRAQNKKMGNLL